MAKNIIILRSVDSDTQTVKTGYSAIELEEGKPVAYGAKSTARNTKGAYLLTAPGASDTKLGFVYNADVTTLTTATGESYRNINSDPRNISYPAGTIVNFNLFSVGQEIGITNVTGTAAGSTHVIIDTTSGGYKYAVVADIATPTVAFEITGTKYVSVGADRVPTVELLCIKA